MSIQQEHPVRSDVDAIEHVAKRIIPYGRQWVDEDDIRAVVEVLRSDWLTTGPMIEKFEAAVAEFVGAEHAVVLANGTAALHASIYAAGIVPGDEVIVPALTFAASANCVAFQGATPVFVDVEPDTLLIDPVQVERKVTPRTKAIVAVDYAGQPCDYDVLREVASRHKLLLIDDACHALGGSYKGQAVGTLADLNAFSFHPVKHITTGEGGAVTTNDAEMARRVRLFRNHGITSDHRQREQQGSWFYEMVDLGYNYRLTDLQCALGVSQMSKLRGWVARRQEIARRYDSAFVGLKSVEPLRVRENVAHAYHLYVIRLNLEHLTVDRAGVFRYLRAEGIGANVHYIPVHLHPYYRRRFGTGPGLCPLTEAAYERIVTIPLFPAMTDEEINKVIMVVKGIEESFAR